MVSPFEGDTKTTMPKQNFSFQAGQIGLIVVLVLAVTLTIGLAIASQSVTNLSISETEEKSLRAFNAAEAGIEETLKSGSMEGGTVEVGDLLATVAVTPSTSQEGVVGRNEVMEVNLKGTTANSAKIQWVNKETECPEGKKCDKCEDIEEGAPASLEIVKVAADSEGNTVTTRYLYNSSTCSKLEGDNQFQVALAGDGNFLNKVNISVNGAQDVVLRIRPIYRSATIEVRGDGAELPVQVYQISSTATTDTGETRTVEVNKSVEIWPPIFDYVLFSGDRLVK